VKTRSLLAIFVSSLLLFTACVPSIPFISGGDQEEETVQAPVRPPVDRPTVAVERGAIIDAVRVLGRVVAENEEGLFFKQNGRLKGIYVQYNQPVIAGTLLADLETGTLETAIQNSDLSLQDLERTLAKARTEAASGQADVTIATLAVEQAQRDLDKARETLAESQGGPTSTEFAQAQTAYTKANADLAAAENAVQLAREAYTKAQQDIDNYRAGGAVDLRVQREIALSNAEQAYNAAQARVNQLQSGGEDTSVLNAQGNLQTAQRAVDEELMKLHNEIFEQNERIKNAQKLIDDDDADEGDRKKAREVTIPEARWEINIRQCQIVGSTECRQMMAYPNLGEKSPSPVTEPLPNTEMARKWIALQTAKVAYDQARAQSANPLPEAQANLEKAGFDLEQARQALQEVESELAKALRTAELNLDAKDAAVGKARDDLDIAKEALDKVQSGVDTEKVRDAELDVANKEANLLKAQVNLNLVLANAEDKGNVAKLENDLKRSRASHQLLLDQLADSRLIAPFDGVIQFIKGKAGESVSAYGEIIGLADPTKLIISADLSEDDAAKVALEQVADITLDAFSSETLKGVITKLPTSLVTTQGVIQDRSITLEIDWPKEGAEIGMLARVTITVQHKNDVLKVPIESVKRSGRRTFVEYMDGDIKRAKNVELGIQTETEVEILSGLEEGFVILQGQ
jgi:macrolide-specific efflux system membrane fusion protein